MSTFKHPRKNSFQNRLYERQRKAHLTGELAPNKGQTGFQDQALELGRMMLARPEIASPVSTTKTAGEDFLYQPAPVTVVQAIHGLAERLGISPPSIAS